MKFPLFGLPNINNDPDISLLDASGKTVSAKEIADELGGFTTLRLMVNQASQGKDNFEITSQPNKSGEAIYSIAHPFKSDSHGRATTGSIVCRYSDLKTIEKDNRLQKFLLQVGFSVGDIQKIRRNLELIEKKKNSKGVVLSYSIIALVILFLALGVLYIQSKH